MILNRYPVRIGTPHQKRYETREEAIEAINRHNGLTHVYVSLYNRGVIDKIAFDFDPKDYESGWDDMIVEYRQLKEHIEDEGWAFMCVFSGNGLHFYIKSKSRRLENPRAATKEVQEKYQQELDLNSDEAIFGDIKRIMRVPNTYHPGAERFCIPLKPNEIYFSQDEIHDLAQSQRDISAVADGEPYPIGKHDKMGSAYTMSEGSRVPGNFNPAEVEPEGTLFPIYPCISNILQNWQDMEQKGHGIGYRRRFLVILHLKETGHSYEEAVGVLKKYMSEKEFYHAVYDEKQVEQIYKRDDLLFPKCDSLMKEIPCIHDPPEEACESKDDLYI